MAVHVPLSLEAQLEARVLMMSTNNILSPANGKTILCRHKISFLACIICQMERDNEKGEGMIFERAEILLALGNGSVSLHAKVKARTNTGCRWFTDFKSNKDNTRSRSAC